MASSSSITCCKTIYDVFISFRGSDTRHNFVSHLYAALVRKHIRAFVDENDLDKGEEISPTLLKMIEESKLFVIIFSENYASSPWCLDELVKIMDCTKTIGQKAIPIFYHVDPSHVSDLTGKFGKEFKKMKQRINCTKDRIKKWCFALEEAANLSGWDSSSYRNEEELIGKIVEHILQKLCPNMFTTSNELVGMNSHIEMIISCLSMGSEDVRFVGLWGMGGIGKTTIAEVLYSKISSQFERYCFFRSVREESQNNGLINLRKKFLSQLLGIENLNIELLNVVPTYIKDSLSRMKVVIVLDDVSDPNQLEALGVGECWFGPGSRIILTSRDMEVFNNVDEIYIYKVEELNESDALELLSLKAFKKKYPPENFAMLSRRVLYYAQGLPLALKVLGSHLCKKAPHEWRIELNKLKKFPDSNIQKVLEISFEGLDDVLKDIFLYICCLKGYRKDSIIRILDGCGFPASWGINRLKDKCLITFSKLNQLQMHDLIQDMGQEIARRKGLLYNNKDIISMSTINTRNETVEVIALNMAEVEKAHMGFKGLSWMPKLQLLNIYGDSDIHFESDDPPCLSSNLSLIHWTDYPFTTLLSDQSYMQNLVELIMPGCKAIQLWDGQQCLPKLKILDLRDSSNLKRLPDLSSATKMEEIRLADCRSLEVLPPCITNFKDLTFLSVVRCINLRSIPSLIDADSLWQFYLTGCLNLKILPEIPSSLEHIEFSNTGVEEWPASLCHGSFGWIRVRNTAIRELPSSIRCLSSQLEHLEMHGCIDLEILPDSICELECLETLYLKGCLNLSKLPPLNGLSSLRHLSLEGSGIVEIPSDIVALPSLKELTVSHCKRLQSLPLLPWQLTTLEARDCTMLQAASITLIYLSNPRKYVPFNKTDYFFNFCNCINLDSNVRSKIMADACCRVEEMGSSPDSETRFTMGLPGSEIPEWFSHQRPGNSIVVQLPRVSTEQLTLAFCVVLDSKCLASITHPFRFRCRCQFKMDHLEFGECTESMYADGVYNSDHVFLWYSKSLMAGLFAGEKILFNFELEAYRQGVANGVMKCGVQSVILQHKRFIDYKGLNFTEDME